MRRMNFIVLLLLAAYALAAQGGDPVQRRYDVDQEHAQWIDSVMRSIATIKTGATRKDLLGVFAEEGGLSTRTRRTFVYKHCPYIKVDVKFVAVGNENDGSTEKPEDKVSTISRPYLAYSIMD